jgi:hypothetical protein
MHGTHSPCELVQLDGWSVQSCWRNIHLDNEFVDCFSIDPLRFDLPRRGVLCFDYVSYDFPIIAHADLLARVPSPRQALFHLKRPSAAVMAGQTPAGETEAKPEKRGKRVRTTGKVDTTGAPGMKGGEGTAGAPPSPKLTRSRTRGHSIKHRAGVPTSFTASNGMIFRAALSPLSHSHAAMLDHPYLVHCRQRHRKQAAGGRESIQCFFGGCWRC